MLYLVNIPCMLGVVMFLNAPVHDGIRQFFSALPFLAYASGIGFYALSDVMAGAITKVFARRFLIAAGFIIFLGYAGFQVKQYHPYELSYYNNLVGGLQGAHKAGMEATYWFDAVTPAFLDEFNRRIPDGARVCVWPPNHVYFQFLQDRGAVKKGVTFFDPATDREIQKEITSGPASPLHPVYLILISRFASFTKPYWGLYTTGAPVFASAFQGVRLVSVYRLR